MGIWIKMCSTPIAEAVDTRYAPTKKTWKSEGNRLAEEGCGQEPEGIKKYKRLQCFAHMQEMIKNEFLKGHVEAFKLRSMLMSTVNHNVII